MCAKVLRTALPIAASWFPRTVTSLSVSGSSGRQTGWGWPPSSAEPDYSNGPCRRHEGAACLTTFPFRFVPPSPPSGAEAVPAQAGRECSSRKGARTRNFGVWRERGRKGTAALPRYRCTYNAHANTPRRHGTLSRASLLWFARIPVDEALRGILTPAIIKGPI